MGDFFGAVRLAIWVNAVAAVMFLLLPRFLFAAGGRTSPGAMGPFQAISRMAAITLAGVMALVSLHALNAFTLLFFYGSLLVAARMRRCGWSLDTALQTPARRLALVTADLAEFRSLRQAVMHRISTAIRAAVWRWLSELNPPEFSVNTALLTVAGTTAAGLTILLRFTHPILETRLGSSESYQVLFATRQLLVQQLPSHSPVLPALIAAISLLTGTDPMQVIRFIDPAVGCLLPFAAAALVRKMTGDRAAALTAFCALGVYVFALPPQTITGPLAGFNHAAAVLASHQWSTGELGLGVLLLLAGLHSLVHQRSEGMRWAWADTLCCMGLAVITLVPLLSLVAVFVIALWPRPRAGLAVVAVGWTSLALFDAVTQGYLLDGLLVLTLPVALALMGALVALAIVWFFALLHREYAPALTSLLLLVCTIALQPTAVGSQEYVEYNATARQALRIEHEFPRQQWVIAAPVEQLAEVYGIGGHLDLARFVADYQQSANDPSFRFALPAHDLFVFVEKQPFTPPAAMARPVGFETLVDPTYRNYRSPAGRASLEFEAFEVCESYRTSHHDASIYYEDAALRIYRFHSGRVEHS